VRSFLLRTNLSTDPRQWRISNGEELFTEIVAGEQTRKGARRVFQPDLNVFLLREPAFGEPTRKCGDRLGKPRRIVNDNEAFHSAAL
jgi:hypothetical protein